MRTIITLAAASVMFAGTSWAQQTSTRTAVLRPDGSQRIETTAPNGDPDVVSVAKGASFQGEYLKFLKQKPSSTSATTNSTASAPNTASRKYVRHEAVIRPDGTQEMHLFDAAGAITVIQSEKGKSLQQSYWEYLAKEGVPCPCGSEPASEPSESKVATLPAATIQK